MVGDGVEYRQLGVFELTELAGRGGMGEVWRAAHRETGMPVGIKVLTAERANSEAFREAFRHEVRAVARLDHPGVVRVFDMGEAAGFPWLAMEWASGGALSGRDGPWAWEDLRALLRALLGALAHVHARGIVHRDLKPDNVLLAGPDSGLPGWRLADFGIARIGGDASSDSSGTPLYMAPEQIRGDGRAQGPWTDLYALGCVAWALSCGRAPYVGEQRAVLGGHLSGALPPFAPLADVPPGFPGWLRGLLRRAPGERFQYAADARAALEALGAPAPWAACDIPEADDATWEESVDETLEEVAETLDETLDETLGEAFTAPEPRRPVEAAPAPAPPRLAPPDAMPRPQPLLPGSGLGLLGLKPTPLTGREEQQAALWAALVDVCRDGSARAIALTGGAGCGKSRLAGWLARSAHAEGMARWIRVDHDPLGGGLRPALARALGIVDVSALDAVRTLALSVEASPEEARTLARWLVEPEADGPVALGEVRRREALLIRSLCRERPLVLWLDDVQWGGASLASLAGLLDGEPLPLLALLTVRTDALEGDAAERLAALEADGRLLSCPVPPLDARACREMVTGLLGLAPELAGRVAERAEGNPLFAAQLVSAWAAADLLQPTPFGYALTRDDEERWRPGDLLALWRPRLEALAQAHSLDALEIAAVLGGEIEAPEWRAACEAAGIAAGDVLEAALDQGLAEALAEGRRWRFVAGMLREALLQRAEVGGRLAGWHRACLSLFGEGALTPHQAERQALHLLGAGEDLAAVDAMEIAVNWRRIRDDYGGALALLRRRDEAMTRCELDPADPRWGQGWSVEASLLWHLGRAAEAEVVERRALEAARRYGWGGSRVSILFQATQIRTSAGDFYAALPFAEEALEAAEALGLAPRSVAMTRISLASVLMHVPGRQAEAVAALEVALSAPEVLDDRLRVAAMRIHGEALTLVDRLPEAGEVLRRCVAEMADDAFPWLGVLAHHDLARLALVDGRHDDARASYEAADRARVMMDMAGGGEVGGWRSGMDLLEGRYPEALAALEVERGDPMLRQNEGGAAGVDLALAVALAGVGQRERCAAALAAADEALRRLGGMERTRPIVVARLVALAREAGWPEVADRAAALLARDRAALGITK